MDPTLLGRPMPAPTAQKPAGAFSARLVFLVLAVLAVLVGVFLLVASSSDGSRQLLERLSARQATTLKLLADGQKNLTDDNLSKLNSELTLVLLSDTNALDTELSKAGIKKIDKDILASETDEATFDKLKTAKLNGQYDTAYRTVLTQRLESLRSLLRELHDKTKSKSLKSVTNAEYTHLSGYINSLDSSRN